MSTEIKTRDRWSVVVTAGLGVFMAQLDATIVNVALPAIAERFTVDAAAVQWVILGYALPLIALVLPIGRWIDGVGRQSALLWAIGGFATAGLLAAAAPTLQLLVAARVLQGAFGSVLFVLLPVLAATAVRPTARGRAMGVVMTLGPLGGFSGPVLGGFLVEQIGPSGVFLVNPIIGVVLAGLVALLLPRDARLTLPPRDRFGEAALLVTATASVLLALTLTAQGRFGWLWLALLAVPVIVIWSRRPYSRPVTRLLRDRRISGPLVALTAQAVALVSVQFLIPFFLTEIRSAGGGEIGLTMLAIPAGMIVLGPVGGWLTDRWGAIPTALSGIVVAAVGFVSLTWSTDTVTSWDVALRLAILGAGTGLFAGANTAMTLSASPPELMATTSAAINMARQIGIAAGPAVASIAWSLAPDGVAGLRRALVVSIVVTAVCFAATAIAARGRMAEVSSARVPR